MPRLYKYQHNGVANFAKKIKMGGRGTGHLILAWRLRVHNNTTHMIAMRNVPSTFMQRYYRGHGQTGLQTIYYVELCGVGSY